jgi:putative transposase
MTAGPSIDLPGWMAEQLSQASPDLLRQMVQRFAALMSADVDAVCGAGEPAQPGRQQHANPTPHSDADRHRGGDHHRHYRIVRIKITRRPDQTPLLRT